MNDCSGGHWQKSLSLGHMVISPNQKGAPGRSRTKLKNPKSRRNRKNPEKNWFCDFEIIFVQFQLDLDKMTGKLHRIILLHLGLTTFWFYYGRSRKPQISWFSELWDTWEPLFVDANIPKYFQKIETSGAHSWEMIVLSIWNLKIRTF